MLLCSFSRAFHGVVCLLQLVLATVMPSVREAHVWSPRFRPVETATRFSLLHGLPEADAASLLLQLQSVCARVAKHVQACA